jgi:hypothetical protein
MDWGVQVALRCLSSAPVGQSGAVVEGCKCVGEGREVNGGGGQGLGGGEGGRRNVDDAACGVGNGVDLIECLRKYLRRRAGACAKLQDARDWLRW